MIFLESTFFALASLFVGGKILSTMLALGLLSYGCARLFRLLESMKLLGSGI